MNEMEIKHVDKNPVPRRNRLDLCTPSEKAISFAIDSVERLPADERLTEAVILLGKARELVSDFIDQTN